MMICHLLTRVFLPSFLMMFAAGTVPPPGGGSGAGGGGDKGGAGGGAGTGGGEGAEPSMGWAGDEGGGDGGTTDDRTTDGEEGAGTEGDFEDFGSESDEEGDTTKGAPKSLKEFVESIEKGLTSQDPNIKKAAEKELKKIYNERQRYQQNFKTPEEATSFVEKVDALGGIEGIESEMGETATFLNGWAAGDEGVISQWMKDNGEGLAKSMPVVAKLWRENDLPGWQHHHASTFMATLRGAGANGEPSLISSFNSLTKNQEFVALAQKTPAIQEAFDRIAEVINAVDATAKQNPTRDLSPEQEKLTKRERELKTKENQLYETHLNTRVTPLLNKSAERFITAVAKGRKFTPEQKKDLVADAVAAFSAIAKKDDAFQKSAKSLKAAGETDKFLKLLKSRVERSMPLAARNVWRKYAGIGGLTDEQRNQRKADGQGRRESGGGSTSSNAIRVKRPEGWKESSQIDWDGMNAIAKKYGVEDGQDLFSQKHLFMKKGDKRLYGF